MLVERGLAVTYLPKGQSSQVGLLSEGRKGEQGRPRVHRDGIIDVVSAALQKHLEHLPRTGMLEACGQREDCAYAKSGVVHAQNDATGGTLNWIYFELSQQGHMQPDRTKMSICFPVCVWSAQLLGKNSSATFSYYVGIIVSSLAVLFATWYSP